MDYKRNYIDENPKPDPDNHLIFHYTSSDGLKGILDSKTLRMTNIKYLNDSKELTHGTFLAKKYLKEAIEDLKTINKTPKGNPLYDLVHENINEAELPYEYRFSDMINESVQGWLEAFEITSPFYAASFCAKGNILRQWMAYCPNGGYSIGLDKHKLKEHIKKTKDVNLKAVNYDQKIKNIERRKNRIRSLALRYSKTLDSILEKYTSIDEAFDSLEQKEAWDILNSGAHHQAYIIAKSCLGHKSESFYDEEEVRLICSNLIESEKIIEDTSKIQFYTKNNILIPYIPFDIPIDIIRKIYIGPMEHQSLANLSLHKYKRKYGYEYEVYKSNISLRTI